MDNYLAWSRTSRKTGLGHNLKRWVENTYLDLIGEPCSLLEIGPGNGEFAHAAIERGFSYCAVERSLALVNRLRAQGLDCIYSNFPDYSDELSGRKFDCIYASHVLEHQDTRAEACAFIAAVANLLKPGGKLVINCPNVLSHRFLFWASDYTHNFVTTPLRVRNLLIDSGFEIVSERRMRFGFTNPVLRALVAFVGLFAGPWMKPFVPIKDYDSDPRIYFRENFTVIARRPSR